MVYTFSSVSEFTRSVNRTEPRHEASAEGLAGGCLEYGYALLSRTRERARVRVTCTQQLRSAR